MKQGHKTEILEHRDKSTRQQKQLVGEAVEFKKNIEEINSPKMWTILEVTKGKWIILKNKDKYKFKCKQNLKNVLYLLRQN